MPSMIDRQWCHQTWKRSNRHPRRGWIRLALCVAACSTPIAASGQGLGGSAGSEAAVAQYPIPVVDRPLTLPRGVLEISAPLGVSLSTGAGGKPTFLNPSISYGVSDRLTVGIRHFLGLCFGGADGNCPKFYNDVGFDALHSVLRAGRLQIAAGASLNFAPIVEPSAASGEIRLPLKFGGDLLAIVLSPTLSFGLNHRDGAGGRKRYGAAFNAGTYDVVIPAEVVPNREVLRVPLTFQMQLRQGTAFLAGVSVDGALDPPLRDFSDVYRIPVMLGVIFSPTWFLDLGAALTFPDLLGQDATLDDRFLSAFVTLRI